MGVGMRRQAERLASIESGRPKRLLPPPPLGATTTTIATIAATRSLTLVGRGESERRLGQEEHRRRRKQQHQRRRRRRRCAREAEWSAARARGAPMHLVVLQRRWDAHYLGAPTVVCMFSNEGSPFSSQRIGDRSIKFLAMATDARGSSLSSKCESSEPDTTLMMTL